MLNWYIHQYSMSHTTFARSGRLIFQRYNLGVKPEVHMSFFIVQPSSATKGRKEGLVTRSPRSRVLEILHALRTTIVWNKRQKGRITNSISMVEGSGNRACITEHKIKYTSPLCQVNSLSVCSCFVHSFVIGDIFIVYFINKYPKPSFNAKYIDDYIFAVLRSIRDFYKSCIKEQKNKDTSPFVLGKFTLPCFIPSRVYIHCIYF